MTLIFETSRFILRQFTWADNGLLLKAQQRSEVVKILHERLLESEAPPKEIFTNIIRQQ